MLKRSVDFKDGEPSVEQTRLLLVILLLQGADLSPITYTAVAS